MFSNYRPISLLPVVSKIFEKVIHRQLINYFTINQLFTDCQYGFRPKMSTEHAALHLYNEILHQLNLKKIHFLFLLTCLKLLIPLTTQFY